MARRKTVCSMLAVCFLVATIVPSMAFGCMNGNCRNDKCTKFDVLFIGGKGVEYSATQAYAASLGYWSNVWENKIHTMITDEDITADTYMYCCRKCAAYGNALSIQEGYDTLDFVSTLTVKKRICTLQDYDQDELNPPE